MSNIETDVPPEDEPRTYRQQSYPKRLLRGVGRIDHALAPGVRAPVRRLRSSACPATARCRAAGRAQRPHRQPWTVGASGLAAAATGIEVARRTVTCDRPSTSSPRSSAPSPGEDGRGRRAARRRELTSSRPPSAERRPDCETEATGLPRHRPETLRRRQQGRRAERRAGAAHRGVRPAPCRARVVLPGGVDDFAADVAERLRQPAAPATARAPTPTSGADDHVGAVDLRHRPPRRRHLRGGLVGFLMLMAT